MKNPKGKRMGYEVGRVERLERLWRGHELAIDLKRETTIVIDDDGFHVMDVPQALVERLDAALLRDLAEQIREADAGGFARGFQDGRETLMRTVHRLIGVDRLVEAIQGRDE